MANQDNHELIGREDGETSPLRSTPVRTLLSNDGAAVEETAVYTPTHVTTATRPSSPTPPPTNTPVVIPAVATGERPTEIGTALPTPPHPRLPTAPTGNELPPTSTPPPAPTEPPVP